MSTATKPRAKKKMAEQQRNFIAEHEVVISKEAAHEAQLKASQKFIEEECQEVTLTVNWFSTTKKVDNEQMKAMLSAYADKLKVERENNGETGDAADEAADVNSVTATKKFFGSKHPAIKAANEAKRALVSYYQSTTMSAAAFAPNKMTSDDARQLFKKDPGTRYIEIAHVEQFDKNMSALADNLIAAVNAINDQLDDIKEFDRASLKKAFFNEKDYPKEVSAQVSWPYKPVQFSLKFAELAPEAYARARKQASDRMCESVDMAVTDFVMGLTNLCDLIVSQTSNRVKLNVRKDHELGYLKDGEVVEVQPNIQSPDNKVDVLVVYKKAGKTRQDQEWFTWDKTFYHETMRPVVSDQQRKFYEGAVLNFKAKIETLSALKNQLGDQAAPIEALLGKLNDILGNMGTTSKEVAEEVRRSNFGRKKVNEAFAAAGKELLNMQKVMPAFTNHRRKIGVYKQKSE